MKVLIGELKLSFTFVAAVAILLLQGCGGIRSFSGITDSMRISESTDEPTIKASSSSPVVTNSQTIPVTFEFEKPVPFKASDIAISGGFIHQCSSGPSKSFTCTVIPKSKNVSLQIVSGTVKSADGQDAGSSNQLSFVVDSADKVYGLCIKKSEFEAKFGSLRW